MKIIEWDEFIDKGLPPDSRQSVSMTVGVFDGVHRGHKELIQRVVTYGVQNGLVPAAITFREPAHKNERAPFVIQSFEEKSAAMEALGIEALIVIDFTEEFSRMTGIEFLETLSAHAPIGFFAVGANFRCGAGLDTDAKSIRNFFANPKNSARGTQVEIMPEVLHDGIPISSSRIREALAEGDLELAEAMIG